MDYHFDKGNDYICNMENIDAYLDALGCCKITFNTEKKLRLNGYRRIEYEKEMERLFQAFRLDLLSLPYSVADFVAISRKVEEAKKQVNDFARIVERTDSQSQLFRPLQSLYGTYRRQVAKTAELVESVNIMKLSQSPTIINSTKEEAHHIVQLPKDKPTIPLVQVNPLQKTLDEYGEFLTTRDLVAIFRCSTRTIYNWEKEGLLVNVSATNNEINAIGRKKRGQQKLYLKEVVLKNTMLQEKFNEKN